MKFNVSVSPDLILCWLLTSYMSATLSVFARMRLWLTDIQGNVLVPFAIASPVVILLVGMGLDMASVQGQQSRLQTIADNGALFAAQEFSISGQNEDRIRQVAISYVESVTEIEGVATDAVVNSRSNTVSVTLTLEPKTFFNNPLGSVESIGVTAVAQLVGSSGNVCLIALDDTSSRTMDLRNNARLTAEGCALYANSTSPRSLKVNPSAQISVGQVYLAGGYQGNINGLTQEPVTDALPISDPLVNRPAPDFGSCDHNNFEYNADSAGKLSPGVYCGGLQIIDQTVEAEPGIYIIKDGRFSVHTNGGLIGTDVGFYLTGKGAKLDFSEDSTLSLEAPRTGQMAGLLFFADRNNPLDKGIKEGTGLTGGHVIRSDDARRLVGTLYLPDDKLVIDGESLVADASEYTIIIARAFELNNGPNLVIRADYAASEVPIPQGVGPVTNGHISLIE